MTKIKRKYNQFKWIYTNRILIGFYVIFIAWLISRFHIDLLWFNQFDLNYVIVRRWLYQFSGLVVAAIISLICLRWQSRWTSLKSNNLARGKDLAISGSRYTKGVLLCLSIFLITLSFLTIYSWRSIVDPFSLFFWWDNLLNSNLFYVLPSIFLFIILIILKYRKLTPLILQLVGSLLFITIFARSWGLWALGLAIPRSGIKEPLLNSDISFALGHYQGLLHGRHYILTEY